MRKAEFWENLGDERVRCTLCPNACVIAPGKRGRCRVRSNQKGELIPNGYGVVVSAANDPIEKKPLYHFLPGSRILSVGCNGCNLSCVFCQNWEVSQRDIPGRFLSPEELATLGGMDDSRGVAFTYSEPLVWFEYILDTAVLLREKGLKVVLVTNGVINPEPLEELLPFVDAMNIDLKSIDPDFYRRYCGGDFLATVKHTIAKAFEAGVHLEVTNLLIPGCNDSEEEVGRLAEWVASVSREIPLHISRFFPCYQMQNLPPTPLDSMYQAFSEAKERLHFVYLGNLRDEEAQTTYCPQCEEAVIKRGAFFGVRDNRLKGGACPNCGTKIYGVFN